MYLNAKTEILVTDFYEGYGLKIVKGKEKLVINTNRKELYLDLLSLSNELNTTLDRLSELISYNNACIDNLAFYRNEENKVIKVLNVACVNGLIRSINGLEFNIKLLKTVREKVMKMIKQIKV